MKFGKYILILVLLLPLVTAINWDDQLRLYLPFNNTIQDFSGNSINTIFNSTTYGICYQETSNISNSCGGKSFGTYNTQIFGSNDFTGNSFDGNYSTRDIIEPFNSARVLYINYSIISNTPGHIWQVKKGESSGDTLTNFTINNSCIQDRSVLELKVNISCIGTPSCSNNHRGKCYNGTDWVLIYTSAAENYFYEEAIFWNASIPNYTTDKLNISNESILLNGVDEYINISSSILNNETLTISTWSNTRNGTPRRQIFGHFNSNDRIYLIIQENSFDIGLGDIARIKTNVTIQDDTWYHISLVLDNSSYVTYINGVQNLSGSYTGINAFIGSFQIGALYAPTAHSFFNGSLDNIRIYNRSLALWEVSNLFNAFNNFNLNVTSNISDYSGSQTQDFDVLVSHNIDGGVTCGIETNNTQYVCGEEIGSSPLTISCDNNYIINTTVVNYNPFCENSTLKLYSESQDVTFLYNGTVNITVYNLNTQEVITDENISINLFNEVANYNLDTNTDNNTGGVVVSGIPLGDLVITGTSDNYLTSSVIQTLTINQTSYNVSLYLANSSDADVGKLFAYTFNRDYYAIKNADTRLQQYFTDIGDFVEVQQCYSDSNGECVFNIILADKRYRIITTATIDNITSTAISSQAGNYYPVDNTEIELYLDFQDEYTAPDDYGLSVTAFDTILSGNTSNLYATFIDIYGNTHEVCLGYYYNDGLNKILGREECTNGSSGTVGFGSSYLLNRNFTWTGEIYTKVDGERFKTYESYRYNRILSFEKEYSDFLNPIIILIMALLLGFSIQLKNILIFPVGMIPTMLVYLIMKPLVFTTVVSAIIIFFCVMLIYVGRKRSDNEAT